MEQQKKRRVDTFAYVSLLRELTQEGREVTLPISGNSMSPFLIHERDVIAFKKPDRPLRRGDMVFYQRRSGQFVMHRIHKKLSQGYLIAGDAQSVLEGPVEEGQIFGLITRVRRKGEWICAGSFWWEFFRLVWPQLLPVRQPICRAYRAMTRLFRKTKKPGAPS